MQLFKRIYTTIKSKKGFTLLEVIVASSVSAIVLMCAIGMFVPLMNSTRANKELADAKNSAARMLDYIQRKVQYSSGLFVLSSDVYSDTSTKTIYQERKPVDPTNPMNSELLITYFTNTGDPADGIDVLGGEDFYSNLDFVITYQQAMDRAVSPPMNKKAVEVTINVTRKKQSKVIYTVTDTLYMFNGGNVDTTGVNTTPATEEFQYIKF